MFNAEGLMLLFVERWLEATGVEYAKSLPLPPEFYGVQSESGDAMEAVDDLDTDGEDLNAAQDNMPPSMSTSNYDIYIVKTLRQLIGLRLMLGT